jgi:hypothetical protein
MHLQYIKSAFLSKWAGPRRDSNPWPAPLPGIHLLPRAARLVETALRKTWWPGDRETPSRADGGIS